MKKHFENAQNLANVVIPSAYIKECHGTLRADDKLSPMEFQATNSNNFARQDCVSEPIEDVSRGAPAAGDGGDQSRLEQLKQLSTEEDGRTTWRKPRETIVESKMSAENSGSVINTKMNWNT